MTANAITFLRLILTFGVIALFGVHRKVDIALIATIAVIFALDAVDGLVARNRNETSTFGANFDTIADRIVENTFWIYFACQSLLPFWMPVIVVSRGFLVDGLSRAVGSPRTPWAFFLIQSRASRALYGLAKMITFLYLAGVKAAFPLRIETGHVFAIAAVCLCLIRGMPILIEGSRQGRK